MPARPTRRTATPGARRRPELGRAGSGRWSAREGTCSPARAEAPRAHHPVTSPPARGRPAPPLRAKAAQSRGMRRRRRAPTRGQRRNRPWGVRPEPTPLGSGYTKRLAERVHSAERAYHRVVRRFLRAWLVLPAAAVVLLGGTVYLPFYSLGPGPARAVQPLIRFDERTRYESDGTFVLTSVRFNQLTPFGVVDAWLDPDESVVSREELFAPGETEQEERERTISEMDQSKLDAAYVVLEDLTDYPEEHGDGVLIQGVVGGCAADGELYPGDLVTAIDGSAVDTVLEARRIIRAAPAGSGLEFDVTVEGDREIVSLVREPSAGLAWALGLYDLLTPGDLTGGRAIATTGALATDGTVFPIGGIEDKVVGAAKAGASVLILPEDNLSDARAAGREDVELVPVSTFAEALAFLQSNA